MGTYKRINVSSGRPLKPLANYSRELRCGDMVLQSGATAIDTMRAFGLHFRDIRPAVTLVEIVRLARPTQLIEIEAEAIVGAAAHVSSCTSADPAGAVRAPGRLCGAVRYLPRGHRGSAGDGGGHSQRRNPAAQFHHRVRRAEPALWQGPRLVQG